jgi:hypothetical protein
MVPPEQPEATDPQEPTESVPAVSPPTKRANRALMIAIGLAVLVLVGGGITIVALASHDSPEEVALRQNVAEARGVAEKFAVLFAQARNDGAFALSKSDVKAVLCAREQDALDQEWQDRENKEISRPNSSAPAARLEMTVRDVRIQGDNGVATLTGAIADRKTDQDFQLLKENGHWKICDVVFRIPKASSSSSSSATDNPTTTTTSSSTDTFPTSPSDTTSSSTSTSETPS